MPDSKDERRHALDRAVRALARRDHSTESLRAKLERAGVSEHAQSDAIEALARAGYVDDRRFAIGRAAELGGRGYGDEWIRADLDAQGVGAEAVAEAIASLEPEPERARRQARKTGSDAAGLRALRRRGFSEDVLESVAATSVAPEP